MTKRYFLGVVILTLMLLSVSLDALAVPANSPRYETSCITCHESPPRLNAVGEAFRLNGYKFPDDELKRKQEPTELGDEAHERLWPETIWPSIMPQYVPISVISTWIAEIHWDPGIDFYTEDEMGYVSFIMPHEIELAWLDTFGEHISFYGDARYLQEDYGGTSLYSWAMLKGWIMFEDIFWENLLNLQIGSVGMHTIGLLNARDEQGMPFQGYLMNAAKMPDLLKTRTEDYAQSRILKDFEGNTFVIQPQTGIELNGFSKHFLYYAGVVNGKIQNPMGSIPQDDVFFLGAGYNTKNKDYYAGFSVKIGGLGFDASKEGDEADSFELERDGKVQQSSSSNGSQFWRGDSLILSFFGYKGEGMITVETWNNIDDRTRNSSYTRSYYYDDFWRLGAGLLQRYKDVTISGGCMWGRNENPYGNQASNSVDTLAWFAEAHYFLYPWLVCYGRYEGLYYDGLPGLVDGVGVILDGEEDREILTGGLKLQIRANVILNIEATYYTRDQDYDYGLDKTVFFILRAGF